ncbi:MAG: hypothetical protein WC863_02390 [Patescibacteria group bacterium]
MRKALFFTTVFSLLLFLTACGQVPGQISSNSSQESPSQAGAGTRRPDFGQPQRSADIRGIVKSIIGNEVTILKIDNINRRASSTVENRSGESNSSSARFSLSPGNSRMAGGARGGQGGFGGPGSPGVNDQDVDRTKMLEELKKLSTGEEKVIIPVGIKMLKPSVDTKQNREMLEATLNDITADKSITIWLSSSVSDKKVAEFVLIN